MSNSKPGNGMKFTSVQKMIPPSPKVPKVQAVMSLVCVFVILTTPGPVIEWLKIILGLSVMPPSESIFPTDKVVHCMMFAVCGFLVCRAWLLTSVVWIVFVMLVGFAGMTEVIQMVVPGRSGSAMDWLADGVGIVLGFWWYQRFSQKKARLV